MPKLLASVASLDEAALALDLGADILDLKNPAEGALGAWPVDELRLAVARFGGRRPLSATTGDLPPVPGLVVPRAEAVAGAGVDYVKVGLFAGSDLPALVAALAPLARRCRLVAVLMADQRPDVGLVPHLADAGFAGAMLDTADKRRGGLRAHMDDGALTGFVAATRRRGLLCGLAGSLGVADIGPLTALEPDYLGFRGALCAGGREGVLDPARFAAVRAALDPAVSPSARAVA
ncbi:MAG TPA: (5-formylfuran-3-yl)methyl phosphate synthase [Geminicoccaceae bacterium]